MVSVAKPKIADRPLVGAKVKPNPQPKKIAGKKKATGESQREKAARKAAIRERRAVRK